jgi:zinc/manganese transport system substrate-binding protein
MKALRLLVSLFILFSGASPALGKITVFACEPEWGALAEEIGGGDVKVINATTAYQDPHFISAKPSLIAAVRRADLVFCNGAELEVGWLPLLLRQGGNGKVQPGNAGFLAAADYVRKLEIPTSVDRALGDIHPQGNPHIIGNPHNVAIVAGKLAERLEAIDPENAANYEQRFSDFDNRWQAAITRWETEAAVLKGAPIVVQHKTWVYLTDWLGLDVVTTLEPRPGIPPTTSHLQKVLVTIKENPPAAIINAAYENDKPSEWLSEKAGVPEVTLPFTVGGAKEATDLFSLFDTTLKLLLGAVK